ncbi:MAG: hypothetical protein AAFW69_07505 [Pseudomonadota bacterium]
MFYELIATFAAGFAAAGVVLLLNRLVGRRLPRWLMPVAAGAAMLAFTIWSEYDWASRTVAGLPEGVVVVRTVEVSRWWKPWTFVAPQTTGFLAVDAAAQRVRDAAPELRLVSLYAFQRWQPPAEIYQIVDCNRAARADVSGPDDLSAELPDGAWITLGPEDPLIRSVCTT